MPGSDISCWYAHGAKVLLAEVLSGTKNVQIEPFVNVCVIFINSNYIISAIL